jgi:hypothetical protein
MLEMSMTLDYGLKLREMGCNDFIFLIEVDFFIRLAIRKEFENLI